MTVRLLNAVAEPPVKMHMPVWIGYASAGLVLVMALVGLWLMVRSAGGWDFGGPDGGTDGGGHGGGGGGGPRRPKDPSPKSDPDWWPEFERAFAAYVSERLPRLDREVGPSRAGPRVR